MMTFAVHARESSFYQGWRTEFSLRLASLLPAKGAVELNQSGVSSIDVARILGVTKAFASQALIRPDYEFNSDHIAKLAQHLGVDEGWLLVADSVDVFKDVRHFEQAIAGERPAVQKLMRHVFQSRLESTAAIADTRSFEERRRATVAQRLGRLMPGRNGAAVSVIAMSEVLGSSKAGASQLAKGIQLFNWRHANAVGERYGVTPEWLLAADMLSEFSDREKLDAAIVNEMAATKTLLRSLWDLRETTCAPELR